jgi:predicted ATPase/class 3 adenylate cyclase/DNA-binding CsgD family transcriptional regulator
MVDDGVRGLGWPLFVEADVSDGGDRAFALPTGTVTFLLSDVEGSTGRWERAPEAMSAAIPRHYELLDAEIVRHGGVRPVEQGEGDSVVGAFSRASDAVAAAIDAQRAFATEPWPTGGELMVRMAVHTGEAQLRGERSYLGHALNRCARIRDAGHGGQVLLSASTAALVADRLPDGVWLEDLGWYRLKDLGRAEHIWQIVQADLPSQFPPLRSLDAFRHNLPSQLTPLIGRQAETTEVLRLVDEERLVTLIGSAGVGKTRLALAVAAEMLDHSRGGVWWIELAPLADHTAVGRAALTAVGAREAPGVPVARQLAGALGDEPTLLVLDNCEHLVTSCAELVAELLATNLGVSVLATSREPLGVPGEITWRVPSLSCPEVAQRWTIPALSQYDAVVLFVERAHRARPSFVVAEANTPAIAQICHRLDGIPLAIELAAARCRQLSAERIASELDDRFRLLTGGARTVMARQQTLAASIEWSHDRLDDLEQAAFRRLGVFAGPFPLEAAEVVVASGGDLEPSEVFDLISRLVDKSLVLADEGSHGEVRYRLLESLRAYALDRARSMGELTSVRDAHAAWWADWLEPRGAMPTDDTLDEIDMYHANLKVALDWASDDPPLGLRLLSGVARAWDQLGRWGDAMPAAGRLLTDDNAEHHPKAWLAAAEGAIYLYEAVQGPARAWALVDRIEQVAMNFGDEYHLALARFHRGGRDEGIRALGLATQRGDRYLTMWLALFVAFCDGEDDPAVAQPSLAAAEALTDDSGSRSFRDRTLVVKARAAQCAGDLRRCIELGREVLESPVASGFSAVVTPLSLAGLLACDHDALRFAAERAQQEEPRAPGFAGLVEIATHRLSLFEGQPSTVQPDLHGTEDGVVLTFGTLWLECREAIDAGETTSALAAARRLTRPVPHGRAVLAAVEAAATKNEDRWHDALAIAVDHGLRLIAVDALEGLAVAAAGVESWAECLRILGAAQRLRNETAYRWRFACEEIAVELARTGAVDALGHQAETATAEGCSLDWHDAVAYARRARGERKRPQHGWASLTPTELQVVALVAEGLTNAQIAERLFMGRATVKTHLEHVFTKLEVRTRAALASEATRRRST